MKKVFVLIPLSILLVGCLNFKINLAFNLIGVYDDTVKLSKVSDDEKEIVFIPMHHVGTSLFYADVRKKIDSLKQEGYFFYTELVKSDKKDTSTIRKMIKLTGIPFSKDKTPGYKNFIDSIYKGRVKLKKEIIDQPSNSGFGLDSTNSKKVDVTSKEIIDYYEKKYGNIILEPCDFEKSFYEKTNCKSKTITKKAKDDAILDFRNANVVNTILKDSHKKIAIIYGANHFKGIKEALVKQGFETTQEIKIKAK